MVTISSIVCPVGQPVPKGVGRPFHRVQVPMESDSRLMWDVRTMHCPANKKEAWVLWDAAPPTADRESILRPAVQPVPFG